MARSHARLAATIWSDPEWSTLTRSAQRAYLLLLSQPKLTLAGSLDLMPGRWANLAADDTPDAMRAALDELQAAGFIEIDTDTDELVIRTFARHDFTPNGYNRNIAKGFWSAWGAILSVRLRHTVVAHLPDFAWTKKHPDVTVPAEAEALKTQGWSRFEPGELPRFEPEDENRSEPQPQDRLEPTVSTQPSTVSTREQQRDVTETDAATEPAAALEQAIDIVMAARHPNGAPSHVGNPGGWNVRARQGVKVELQPIVAQHPDWPPQHLADALTGTRVKLAPEDEFVPAAHPPKPGPAFDRTAHANCTECDGMGDVRDADDNWIRQCDATPTGAAA